MEQSWLYADPIPDGDTYGSYPKLLHVTAANAIEIIGENLDMGAKNALVNQVHVVCMGNQKVITYWVTATTLQQTQLQVASFSIAFKIGSPEWKFDVITNQ